MKPGHPCPHPGCAAHLSHPCENCGRYAAGLANGPNVEVSEAYIRKMAITDPFICSVLELARQNEWPWKQTLTYMVLNFYKISRLLEFALVEDRISRSSPK